MLIRVTTVEVCDATDDASSNAADKNIKNKLRRLLLLRLARKKLIKDHGEANRIY